MAYGSLLHDRRKELHGRVVDAIEALYADRLDEQTELLAHHAQRGERWASAVSYTRRAGQRVAARAAYREALGWFEQAVAAQRHLPEDRDALDLALSLRLELRWVLGYLAMFGPALAYLEEADQIAEALGDRRRQGGVRVRMIECLSALGRHDEAVEVGERALHLAEELADEGFRVYALHQLAEAYRYRGERRRAVDLMRSCIEASDKTLDLRHFGVTPSGLLAARPNLIRMLGELGDFDEAIAHGAESIRAAEASGVLPMVVLASHLP